jgi:glucose dehydrogenase
MKHLALLIIAFGFSTLIKGQELKPGVVWTFKTKGPVSSSPAIGLDGTVYVGSELPDQRMYALDGKTGAKKWE